jgi:hypothetical protein
MVKRIALVRVISFCLLAACGMLCQNARPLTDLHQGGGPNPTDVESQQMRVWRSLPDAPSVQPPTLAETFATFVDQAPRPLTLGAVGLNAGLIRTAEWGHLTPTAHASFTPPCTVACAQTKSSIFFVRYLYPSVLKQNGHYHPSTSGSFMNRAAYAASQIFITRDESGKGRLNTSYFLGALTSVAIRTAHRPYWARSASAPFNDFGSTIGNDAGLNLFHEFSPGIRQMMRVHEPKFVSRIELRITHDQSPKEVVLTPAR